MQIRRRLQLNSAGIALLALAIVCVFGYTANRVNRALEAAKITDAISISSYERLLLRTDSHRTGNERTKVQLIAKHKEVGDLLRLAAAKFADDEDQKTIRELLTKHESIGYLSRTIRENRARNGKDALASPLFQETENLLLSQLNTRVYESVLLQSRLQRSADRILRSSLKLAAAEILLVLLMASSLVLVNSVQINRIFASRIAVLLDGTARVGGGDLEHLIEASGTDELSDLGRSFNEMTGKLRASYGDLHREIEERKLAEDALRHSEEMLRASLADKEVLLKEIHHRVKNNLQVISSLVSLQAAGSTDPTVNEVLKEVSYRVRSMALVHEKLYQSADLAHVDFADYLKSLLGFIWRAHGSQAADFRLVLELEPVYFSVDTAVSCGLILNELAGNTLKHAFKGRSQGVVRVTLKKEDQGAVRVSVADDGVGLPEGMDWTKVGSLGLRLVQMLSGQLGARVGVESCGGTCFEIVLPPKKAESAGLPA